MARDGVWGFFQEHPRFSSLAPVLRSPSLCRCVSRAQEVDGLRGFSTKVKVDGDAPAWSFGVGESEDAAAAAAKVRTPGNKPL